MYLVLGKLSQKGSFFNAYTKEDDDMKFEVCMKYACKNCKNKLKCFKEESGSSNEYSKNKHRKSKNSRI